MKMPIENFIDNRVEESSPEAAINEAGVFSLETINTIDKEAEAALHEIEHASVINPERSEEYRVEANNVKNLAQKAKETIFMYTKLIVLSGFLFVAEGDNQSQQETSGEILSRAKHELKTSGITREQKKAYKSLLTDMVHRGIFPAGYGNQLSPENFVSNIINGREFAAWGKREEAWRMYLGLPQESNTFDISEYKPSKGDDDRYYYKINDFWEEYFATRIVFKETKILDVPHSLAKLVETIKNNKKYSAELDDVALIMGNYKIDIGEDQNGFYVAYYDLWDLAIPLEESGVIGKPFEIYDRLYYNPKTFEPVDFNREKFEKKYESLQKEKKEAENDLPG